MPRIWSHANPVDIVGDADGARYAAALDILADDRSVDAVLAMNVPDGARPRRTRPRRPSPALPAARWSR